MNTRKTLKSAALGLLGIGALAFTFYAGTQYPKPDDVASQIASPERTCKPIMTDDRKANETGEAGVPAIGDPKVDKTAEIGRTPIVPDDPKADDTGDASRKPGVPGDPNMIATLQADGTRRVWLKEADRVFLHKYSFSSDGSLASSSVYRLDPEGNPMNCKIYDNHQVEIYKAWYGYRKSDGQLVEERFFDSQTKRLSPVGDEIPVRRFIFEYDPGGKSLETIVVDPVMPPSAKVDPKGFPTESFDNPFMPKRENPNAEKPGAGQPATKPADKVPAKVKPSPPTSKDDPR